MKHFIILTSLVLSACATTTVDKPISVIAPTKIVVDSKLLQACSALEPVPETTTADDLVKIYFVKVLELYGDCANRQEASIEAIKKLANIKD